VSEQPTDGRREPPKDNFLANAARYTSIATSLPAGVVVGYVIGYALDSWLHTTFLKIVFLLLGIAVGFTELIRLLLRDIRSK